MGLHLKQVGERLGAFDLRTQEAPGERNRAFVHVARCVAESNQALPIKPARFHMDPGLARKKASGRDGTAAEQQLVMPLEVVEQGFVALGQGYPGFWMKKPSGKT